MRTGKIRLHPKRGLNVSKSDVALPGPKDVLGKNQGLLTYSFGRGKKKKILCDDAMKVKHEPKDAISCYRAILLEKSHPTNEHNITIAHQLFLNTNKTKTQILHF